MLQEHATETTRSPNGDAKFATLCRARRVWAVGSIHGDADRLARLQDDIYDRFAPNDRLVYLGNWLGRGPDVTRTVDYILAFRLAILALPGMEPWDVVFLRGAQEEMWQKLLQLQFATAPVDVFSWLLDQGVEPTLRAYGGTTEEGTIAARDGPVALTRWTSGLREAMNATPGHAALMSSLRHAALTDDGNLLFVNAGLDPDRPLDAQGDAFWWGGPGFDAIARPYDGFRMIVRGFIRDHGGIEATPFTTSIDGGCGFGGTLMAVCFSPDGEIIERLEAR